ncbi:unnamed protein product [Ilex paraguariensis]|uniref:Uncharacterized protein n=1 Tax=Ilex paraguariensis TaxID=185542 RepID=A0ABC8S2A4_9AQUA
MAIHVQLCRFNGFESHSHGSPITLSKIASGIASSSPDTTCLARIMRLLVLKKIFTVNSQSNGGEPLYSLTPSSKWLLHDTDLSLAPILLMENHLWAVAPWHCLSSCVKEGGIAFQKAHGHEIWEFAALNPEFNKMFNEGMACTAKITLRAIISSYEDGFRSLKLVVDVVGGTVAAMVEIVKAYPHIKVINFDLPHVVATAPEYHGVYHVGGDMFDAIPKADAVFMKWILHDWSDEHCVKILKNCRKAIPEKTGKVIIIDVVLNPEGDGLFDNTGLVFDLVMIAHTSGRKERTEPEWKRLLEDGGFLRYKIIKIPALPSIIEAYPE